MTEQVAKRVVPLENDLSWQMLRGADGSAASAAALETAAALLQAGSWLYCRIHTAKSSTSFAVIGLWTCCMTVRVHTFCAAINNHDCLSCQHPRMMRSLQHMKRGRYQQSVRLAMPPITVICLLLS